MNGFRLSVVFFSVLAIPAMVGCTRVEATPGQHTGTAGESQGTAPAADMAPRMVIPATGGAPILGIPVGGGLYIPVTGGAPIPGTPVTP
jgi:hypothetical protein